MGEEEPEGRDCRRGDSHEIAPAAVLEHLERILASPDFKSAEQMRRMLHFLVVETIEGRESRLKAYTIAVEALGRPINFDPQNDSSVRVLAARLRRALLVYRFERGADDDIAIDIPLGSYVPRFTRNPVRQPDALATAPGDRKPMSGFQLGASARQWLMNLLFLLLGMVVSGIWRH